MKKNREMSGSVEAFMINWKIREEGRRYHFKKGKAENQIQFAFQNHWRVFRRILGGITSGRVLEVGAGRGSMGAFFANEGFETHLLDTSSDALKIATLNFENDQLKAEYVCGDALVLPYPDKTFNVVTSIGLFEHFSDIQKPLIEQIRVLKPGGVFLGYVVPERFFSVQLFAHPINFILEIVYKSIHFLRFGKSKKMDVIAKEPLFRNDYISKEYLDVLKTMDIAECGSFGMFPVPLISHSPRFPFSLMHPFLERILVAFLTLFLFLRRFGNQDPWICSESWGLAFLVWARRKEI